jgi:hypothetical protein
MKVVQGRFCAGLAGPCVNLGIPGWPGKGVGSAMSALTRLMAAMAICASASLAPDAARAASIDITGGSFGAFPGYSGGNISKNNVINYDPSGIDDNKGGSAWHIGGAVIAKLPNFAVDWYFNGAESGDKIKFTSGSVYFTESDQNNRYSPGNDPGFKFIGTSTGSGANTPISFTLLDTNSNIGVTNGVNNHLPGAHIASLMFAYLEPDYDKKGKLEGWKVTKNPTNWFAFGFNDPGSTDKDHDDYVGVGYIRALPPPPVGQTPLPGALPLMGSALGAGSLVGWWRRRRQQHAARY